MQKAGQVLPEALIAEIMAKKEGHSVADMEAYVSRAPVLPPKVAEKPIAPADISKVRPESVTSRTITSELRFKDGVTAEMMDAPPGVVYHEDTGVLEWTPPPFSKTARVGVLFVLTNADGTEETYIHAIERK